MSEPNAIQLIGFVSAMREPKNVAVNIRMSESERIAFQRAAEKEDMSLSDWFRRLGRKRLEDLGITFDLSLKTSRKSR